MVFRKETFSYIESFYRCNETGIEFTTPELDDENIAQVYTQYREKYGIPSAAEIAATREKYGLSAAKMSEVLGLGINQYRLYEKGEIPSQSTGKMLALITDPNAFRAVINRSRKQFSREEYRSLMNKINSIPGSVARGWRSDSGSDYVSDCRIMTQNNNYSYAS